MKKIYFLAVALFASMAGYAQTVIYSNNFEGGVGNATIVGSGQIEVVAESGFNSVFHNAVGGQLLKANYLKLPNDIFTTLQTSGSKELSIAFWVNKGTATNYMYTPLFTAYATTPVANVNTWPMLALQSRLLAQVNCGGYTDMTNAENVSGTNLESSTWLDDAAWHYYTATYTETSVKIYVDGVLKNAWTLSSADPNKVSGLFTNGSELQYICLGGNQAWDWNDVDAAYMYDDLTIYSSALTVNQINATIAAKSIQTAIELTPFDANSQLVSEMYFSINGTEAGADHRRLEPGIYIKRAVYSNGAIVSTKIVRAL